MGGFGITYLATQAGLNRHVAVKEFFMGQFCERDATTSAVTVGSRGSRDVAHVKWGSSWRMPTWKEFDELIDNCDWEWTTLNGVSGYRVTGKNGNSIFLPAAGWRYGASIYSAGESGSYLSSTPYGSDTQYAYCLYFYSVYHDWYWSFRYYGLSVRPVSEF